MAMLLGSGIRRNQMTHKQFLLESKANDISDQMNMLIARVQTMRFMLMSDGGSAESFDELAPQVVQGWDKDNGSIIRNVAVAPDGIISQVYPLKGNEPLLGYDLWKASEGSPEAVKRMKKGKVVITPPIDLMQGGSGMILSLPVTMPYETESWGMAAMVVDESRLIQTFLLNDFAAHNLEYALSYKGLNGEYVVMTRSGGKILQPYAYEFQTENLEWRLEVTGTLDSSGAFTVLMMWVSVVAMSLLLATVLAGLKDRRLVNEMLREMANTDSVTGCGTRHFVYEKLVDQETGKWYYDDMKYSLAILDVDMFKQFNDVYGHYVGDQVLQSIAQTLLNALSRNKGDCAIRFGGDEFVLLFGDRTPEQLRDILFHILKKVREIRLPDAPDVRITISIGGVHYSQVQEEATYTNLLREADKNLYQAKEDGRNRCVV